MTPVKLRIVQCVNHLDGNCKAGHFGGRPSPLTCARCPHAQTVNGDAILLEQDGFSICLAERTKWMPDGWQLLIDARITLEPNGRMTVPSSAVHEAQRFALEDEDLDAS